MAPKLDRNNVVQLWCSRLVFGVVAALLGLAVGCHGACQVLQDRGSPRQGCACWGQTGTQSYADARLVELLLHAVCWCALATAKAGCFARVLSNPLCCMDCVAVLISLGACVAVRNAHSAPACGKQFLLLFLQALGLAG